MCKLDHLQKPDNKVTLTQITLNCTVNCFVYYIYKCKNMALTSHSVIKETLFLQVHT